MFLLARNTHNGNNFTSMYSTSIPFFKRHVDQRQSAIVLIILLFQKFIYSQTGNIKNDS